MAIFFNLSEIQETYQSRSNSEARQGSCLSLTVENAALVCAENAAKRLLLSVVSLQYNF